MALRVNGELIDDAAIREQRRILRRAMSEQMPGEPAAEMDRRAGQWARENLIEQALLRQAAMCDPQPVPSEQMNAALQAVQTETLNQPGSLAGLDADQLRSDVELKLRTDRLLARVTANVARPRRKDIVEYYKKHRESFEAPEAVRAAHIVKNVGEQTTEESARAAIEAIQARLRAGESFEKLADECSDCPGRGGDLGYFGRNEMVQEFEQIAFTLEVGGVSDIVRTSFGFHLIQVADHRPAGILPLEAVMSRIEEKLFNDKREKVIHQYLDAMRAKASVQEISAS